MCAGSPATPTQKTKHTQGDGDTVTARVLKDQPGQVVIQAIEGDGGRLSLEPSDNCVGIAAAETLKLLGSPSCGVALTLNKVRPAVAWLAGAGLAAAAGGTRGAGGRRAARRADLHSPAAPPGPDAQGLPLGSGMGSSAASAAAAAWAVNGLFGAPLSKADLVPAGLASEATVSGYHADNIGPALLGGFVLIRSTDPLALLPLRYGGAGPNDAAGGAPLWFALVNPTFEAPTKEMRAVLPQQVPFKALINNCCQGGSLVAAILSGDAALLGAALDADAVVEPVRAPLIPGMLAVKEAAKRAGGWGVVCARRGCGQRPAALLAAPRITRAADGGASTLTC